MAEYGKAAVYCRLAQKDDDRMDTQRHLVIQYATELGYEDITSYCDNGASGNDFDRPAFIRLNADIAEGKIKVVFARSIDRFGRDFLKTERCLNSMRELGVTVETMDGYCDEPFHNILVQVWKEFAIRAEAEKTRPCRRATKNKVVEPILEGVGVNGA